MALSQDKKYDVAISLRWTDVDHARALYELLRDRLDVFLADERLEEFVGTDGEESFGHVFRDQARVVVVFYRPDWGETPFTRAEESAIKQRAWHDGYEFSIWVPMDDTKSIPAYLPPQHIWYDFDQYGVNGLASVVEERVRQSGREVKAATITDRLQAAKRRIELAKQRRTFENSQAGVDFVADARSRLQHVIESQLEKYRHISAEVAFKLERESDRLNVTSWPFRSTFLLDPCARNSVSGASITVYLGKREGESQITGTWTRHSKSKFIPTLDEGGEPYWQSQDGMHFTLEALVAFVLDPLAEKSYEVVEQRVRNW